MSTPTELSLFRICPPLASYINHHPLHTIIHFLQFFNPVTIINHNQLIVPSTFPHLLLLLLLSLLPYFLQPLSPPPLLYPSSVSGPQLAMTVLMTCVVIYMYTVIAFNFFRKFYTSNASGQEVYNCDSMARVRNQYCLHLLILLFTCVTPSPLPVFHLSH